jgi:hypothetical protein
VLVGLVWSLVLIKCAVGVTGSGKGMTPVAAAAKHVFVPDGSDA